MRVSGPLSVVSGPLNQGSCATWCRFCALAACVWCGAGCSRQGEPRNVIEETFAGGTFDHTAWRMNPHRLEDVSFTIDGDGLAIHAPAPATEGKPPELKSWFKFGGDFDVTLEYTIGSLPTPEKDSLNLEISLYGPAGSASFRRTQHATRGRGYSVWFDPSQKEETTVYRFTPLERETESRSELLLRRRGGEITFLARTAPDEAREIGGLEYPSSVNSIQFRVLGKPVSEAVDVRFHRVRGAADRIWYGPPGAPEPGGWAGTATIAALALVVVLGAAGYWRYRTR